MFLCHVVHVFIFPVEVYISGLECLWKLKFEIPSVNSTDHIYTQFVNIDTLERFQKM